MPSLAEIEASPVTKLLAEAGYQIVGWHPPSVFFARSTRPPEGVGRQTAGAGYRGAPGGA